MTDPDPRSVAIARPTEKLFWADPLGLSFETRGVALASLGGRPSLVLDRTLFYPEGGGQLGDAGTLVLGDVAVAIADTQVDDGVIHHLLDAALPGALAVALASTTAVAVTVRGTVAEARRRDHMVQHTAQHALSRALADTAGAATVSARLGLGTCTIDVARPSLSDAELHRAEDLVNAVVMSDVAVVTSFPDADELARLPLRKQPNAEKSASGVRVVAIEGFDLTPCGGTHCTRTGQIGQIRITATEKYKGLLRLTFHAGRRALDDARSAHAAQAALARELTCGRDEIATAIGKLRGDAKLLRDRLEGSRKEIAELLAARLLGALPDGPDPQVVSALRTLDDLAGLRALANELTREPRVVALVATPDPTSGELVVVVQRGASGRLDCGAFVMAQAKAQGGRGGGRPERAEGRFPRPTSLDVLADAARAGLTA